MLFLVMFDKANVVSYYYLYVSCPHFNNDEYNTFSSI